jgi:hypothetical protein
VTLASSGSSRFFNFLATLVVIASGVAALFLILFIILVAFGANPHNDVVHFISYVARHLVWIFRDLFTPKNVKLRVLVNYGIAAIVYLVAGQIIARLLRLIG